MPRCLCDDVVVTDVNPKEPEAADFLHRGPSDGDGAMSFSLTLIVVNQPLSFADIEIEVFFHGPRCQGSVLLSVSCPIIVICDQADDGHVVSKLIDGVGAVGDNAVLHEDVVVPIRTA